MDELQMWKSCIENGEMSNISKIDALGMWKSCLENGGRSWSLWCLIEKLNMLNVENKKNIYKVLEPFKSKKLQL
jgi:hypothetical protein